MALASKMKEKKITFLRDLKLDNPKTSILNKKLNKPKSKKILFIDQGDLNKNFKLALRNIANSNLLPQIGANVYDILNCDRLYITEAAVKSLEERL